MIMAIGKQGCFNQTCQLRSLAEPRSQKSGKWSKMVDFLLYWRWLAGKRLNIQSSAAHLLNRLGLGNKFKEIFQWPPTLRGRTTSEKNMKK